MKCNLVMLVGPDRYRLTRQALTTLVENTDVNSFTLTLVCDELDFRTHAMIDKTYKDGVGASVLHVENSNHTISQLKNIGVAWSEQRWGRGDWLYISDSDVAFTPGWLEKLTNLADYLEVAEYKLFGGQVHPFHKPIQTHGNETFKDTWTEHTILDGPSWLMRWDTWHRFGPFDRTTAPGVCQSEEYPFCERMREMGGRNFGEGARIGVIQPHVVYHTGLTHLNGHDCVGRKERELMIPKGILAE